MENNENRSITIAEVQTPAEIRTRVAAAARALLDALPSSSEERTRLLQQVLGAKLGARAMRAISALAVARDAEDGSTEHPINASMPVQRSTTAAAGRAREDDAVRVPSAAAQPSRAADPASVTSCRSCAGDVLSRTQEAGGAAIAVVCVRCGDSWTVPPPAA